MKNRKTYGKKKLKHNLLDTLIDMIATVFSFLK
jgi:hypothetical protein